MRQEWEPEELVACWTLLEDDWRLVGNKRGPTRLGFAVVLKFFEQEARFPRHAGEVPTAAVVYAADQVKVDPGEFGSYDFSGRTVKYHRAQIREAFGFREATRADEDRLSGWLAEEVCPVELDDERIREALLARCRAEKIEPPGRAGRIVGAARSAFEHGFCERTVSRLSEEAVSSLEELVATDEPEGGADVFSGLKADPGPLGLETLLREIGKLERVQEIGLPDDLFADASEKLLARWRARAAQEYAAWMRKHPRPVRLTLLAVLCWSRSAEITDALVELLIRLVHKIDVHAEKRVEGELIADLKRVRGKEGLLFSVAEAAVENPDETVRRVLYPVVGEDTPRNLLKEAKANKAAFDTRVRTVLRSSYSGHYRRAGAHSRRRPGAVARGGDRREGPHRAHPLRGVRFDVPARGRPAARDLGLGRRQVAKPRRRPAPRLRGEPRRTLLRPAQVHRPVCFRSRSKEPPNHRTLRL